MRILVRIAFRNIKLNMRKSLLLGFTIFFCSFLLLTVNSAMNGAEKQVIRNYKNLQVGDIIVMWDKLKKTDASSPQRFINVYESLSFDVKEDVIKFILQSSTRYLHISIHCDLERSELIGSISCSLPLSSIFVSI